MKHYSFFTPDQSGYVVSYSRKFTGHFTLRSLTVLFMFLALLPGTAPADFLEDASAPFVQVDSSIEHERYPIAIPLKGGQLRILFIGRRDAVGLVSIRVAARLDCTFQTILTESRKLTGIPSDRASFEAEILSFAAVEKLAGQLFREQWDVIWLDFDLQFLPEGFRLTILDRVEKGAGLVYVGNRRDLNDLKIEGKIDNTQLRAVTFGIVTPECPGRLKRGNVTVMPPLNLDVSLLELGDYFTTAVNTILFASGRFTMITVDKIPEVGKIVEQESIDIMNYRINLSSSLDTRPLTIFVRYRNELGGVEAESSTTYKVDKGKSFVIVGYPFLPMGAYSVDVSITDQDGVIALAGTSFIVVAQRHLTNLEFWEMSAPEGGLIIGKVKASTPYTDAMRVRVELRDCHGRLIERNELIPDVNLREVDFGFKISNIKERALIVRASLIQSNRIVQRLEKPVFVQKQFDYRRFSLVVSDSRPSEATAAERYQILRDAGVTALDVDVTKSNDPHDIYETVLAAASSGAGVIPRITRIASSVPGNIMDPVITDLKYNNNLEKRVAAIVDTLIHLSPVAFSLGRDNMLTPFDSDVSFSETDIESFTNYLQEKYETVDSLNSAWHTNYSSFENAQPIKFADAVRTKNYAPWLDTRLHMEEVFTQVHYGAVDAFKTAKSTAPVGIDGFENALSPFRGYNLFELTGFLTMVVSGQDAGPGLQEDRSVSAMLSSFIQPGSLAGLSLSGDRYRRSMPALLHAAPWQSLFLGMNSIWWRSEAYGSIESALTPQLTLSPAFSVVAEETKEIENGIDVLLLGGVRLVDPVGILYSPVSKMASITSGVPDTPRSADSDRSSGTSASGTGGGNNQTAGGSLSSETPPGSTVGVHAYENAIRSLYLACQDAGYTPMFVSDDQLTGDWLTEKKYRILILPYIQSMADETVKCIEQFVRNGGTVIADMRTGVMDGHLFTRKTGVLDELFGISQGAGRTAPRVIGRFQPLQVEGGLPADNTIESCLADPSVRALEGSFVMADVSGTPAVIVNRYGKGTAIFLNMGMEGYEKLRAQGQEKKFRNVISWCLFTSGIGSPYCSVRDSTGILAPKVSVTVFRDDVIEYVGLLPDPLAARSEYGNNSYFLDLSNTGKTYYVYDVRKNEFLGANLSVPLELEPGKAELFALFPYRIQELDMRLKTPVIQVGGTLEYTVSVVPQPPGLTGGLRSKPARHVFSVNVTGPGGTVMPFYSESLEADKGILKSSLIIAPDDTPGRWILGITDIVTGKRAERAFMVMATGNLIVK